MRKLFFWLHLICGTAAAIVIFIMSVTGVLLMYERQMLAWADKGYRSTPGTTKMQPEALLQKVAEQTGSMPGSLTLHADPSAPAEVGAGRQVTYVDAYSGRVLGGGSPGIRAFFHAVTDWHRWLAMEGSLRTTGRAITGASNLIFLVLALSGMYLWLPRKWLWQNLRAVLLFRGGLSGKARDFNWHNVIGIWSAIPLVVVILGALVISYPWATALVYRAAGEEPPASFGPPGGPAGPGGKKGRPERGGESRKGGRPEQSGEGRKGGRPDSPPGLREPGEVNIAGLDAAWQRAEATVPGWQSITWRAAGGRRVSLSVAESHRGRVDLRSTLTVDRTSGEVISHEKFDSLSRGRQWRMWLRFLHTGEALGVIGQTIAGIVSAGAAALVWTGLALTWRRYRAWRDRQKARSETLEPVAQV